MANIGQAFLDQSRRYLRDEYHPKIQLAVDTLSTEDIWWRPNEASNSVGNLILHLAGNARQWIVSGVGEEADIRHRHEEFDARSPQGADVLMPHLAESLGAVERVLADLTPDRLQEPRQIQGYDVTVFQAIYHVVEHFSMHTGQITYLTKLRTGSDLGFYEVTGGLAMPRWPELRKTSQDH